MPPPAILDPSTLTSLPVVADREEILRTNPHRYEFQFLDAVILVDVERRIFAGYHDLREDAFWVRGHVPGRPLFPGVLMIECAAQLASFMSRSLLKHQHFLGFTGLDDVKFRGTVTPPARLFVGRATEVRLRRFVLESQGFVDGTMVFQGVITGMPV
jgi:3-hydroxyacyl-[acyl-carrier-protein] dehydratase